jgi:TRAP-type C4-dicarboxylate transport system permease large subunit
LGGIYGDTVTATEAADLGALCASPVGLWVYKDG